MVSKARDDFPEPLRPGHDDQFVARQPQVDVLEIVLLGTADHDLTVLGRGRLDGHRAIHRQTLDHIGTVRQHLSVFEVWRGEATEIGRARRIRKLTTTRRQCHLTDRRVDENISGT